MVLAEKDAVGVLHPPAKGEPRIVSLVPSLTELLFALELGESLVGRTHYCIHPKAPLRDVPSLGGTKKIRMTRLLELAPTHVLMNVDENPKAMADAISEAGIEVIATHPLTPLDNLPLYRLLGGIFDRAHEAEALCDAFLEAYGKLEEAAKAWPKRNVLYLIWKDPWMTVARDTYISETLRLLRWQTIGQEGADRYPKIELSPVLLQEADIVLFSSEPYAFQPADLDAFRKNFPEARARPIFIDGEMTSWFGSHAIAGLDYLRGFAERLAREEEAQAPG